MMLRVGNRLEIESKLTLTNIYKRRIILYSLKTANFLTFLYKDKEGTMREKKLFGWIWILLFIVILSTGCATSFQGVCRHEAIYAVSVVGERYPVRIAVGKSAVPEGHSQAQAFINGRWEWLKVRWPNVVISIQDSFSPEGYVNGEVTPFLLDTLLKKGRKK
ncbi:MAG: hypothetical protein UU87_C0003G0068 [Parcubacteria group bacterium GW2011_GWA2_42_11]|nr:MAG: hypothetical protein UU87_C0003G0068 [Parcubacteria group bacterium GW2011_GWA2_42_11]